jgi:hypothetical protein
MTSPGYISEHEMYSIPEFLKRLRMGRHSLRFLRSEGLEVLKIGRVHMVSGKSLIEILERIGKENLQKQNMNEAADEENENMREIF